MYDTIMYSREANGSDIVRNKKLLGKILNIAMNTLIVIFGIVLLISIYGFVQVNILGNDRSSFFGYSLFEVQSGSMSPAIEKGDWIVVKYANDIELGDIVTYKEGENYITHRVVSAYGDVYTTRGDANSSKDDPIVKEQIVGKVTKILPAFGIFRATIFNPYVLIALIITLYIVNLVFKKNTNGSVSMKKIDLIVKFVLDKGKDIGKSLYDKVNNWLEKRKEISSPQTTATPLQATINTSEIVLSPNDEVEKDPSEDLKPESISDPKVDNESLSKTTLKVNEDFDKTLYFRTVKVDKEDIDNLNRSTVEPIVIDTENNEEDVTDDEEVSENVVEENLELLYKKRRKFKNIIDKAMFMKEEELNEILDILNEEDELKINEATIREMLVEAYIDGKYYNYCGDVNVEYDGRNVNTRLCTAISNEAKELVAKYRGSDKKFEEKVDKYSNMLQLICYLEHAYKNMTTVADKREFYKNKILKYMTPIDYSAELLNNTVNKIIRVQNKYRAILKYIMEKLETNMFVLKYSSTSKKNVFASDLDHNVSFSKVYSDYIIDKTYSDGIIAEDKLEVQINLLLLQLLKDMLAGDFNKKYILYVRESLYGKVNKLIKIFKLFEDDYAKSNVIILVRYDYLTEYKKNIIKLMKAGYKFMVDLEDNDISVINESIVQMMEYIVVNKNSIDKEDGISAFKELENRIMVDNISEKIGSYWCD